MVLMLCCRIGTRDRNKRVVVLVVCILIVVIVGYLLVYCVCSLDIGTDLMRSIKHVRTDQ